MIHNCGQKPMNYVDVSLLSRGLQAAWTCWLMSFSAKEDGEKGEIAIFSSRWKQILRRRSLRRTIYKRLRNGTSHTRDSTESLLSQKEPLRIILQQTTTGSEDTCLQQALGRGSLPYFSWALFTVQCAGIAPHIRSIAYPLVDLLSNINRCCLELKFVCLNEQRECAGTPETVGCIGNQRNRVSFIWSQASVITNTPHDIQHHKHLCHLSLTRGKYMILKSETWRTYFLESCN